MGLAGTLPVDLRIGVPEDLLGHGRARPSAPRPGPSVAGSVGRAAAGDPCHEPTDLTLLRFTRIVVLGVSALALVAAALLPQIGKLPRPRRSPPGPRSRCRPAGGLPHRHAVRRAVRDPGRGGNRDVVTLDQISPELQKTVLAVEDADFYDHDGVSVRSILRAFRASSERAPSPRAARRSPSSWSSSPGRRRAELHPQR